MIKYIPLLALSCAPASPKIPAVVYQQYDAVIVTAQCGETPIRPIGSGVIATTLTVATASHVVDGACLYGVLTTEGKWHPAIVTRSDPKHDAAVLMTPIPLDMRQRPVAGPRPDPGSVVCLATWLPSPGNHCGIVQPLGSKGGSGGIWWDGIVQPGNSGSALYQDGKIVGIVTHMSLCYNGQLCGGRATEIGLVPWVLQ